MSDGQIAALGSYTRLRRGTVPSVIIDGPKIDSLKIKRVLVREVTDALEKAYGLPRDIYVVLIKENSPENVGVGGRLVLDKIDRSAKKK